ncbi:peroxidase family protein [Bradyrhizobium lablabi]|uniref:peroxidase family protein n=1 Tax=Bradyrhizobium lablabi TaxID=722472 RepID=UPI002011DF34|nr:peroxidase family protein [Bradyrhizobium lablabi]
MVDFDGPGGADPVPVQMPYTPGNDVDGPGPNATPGDVIDPSIRIISNLIVDQTLSNPSAILTALQNAGVDDPGLVITGQISAAYAPLRPLFIDVAEAQRAQASAAAAAAANPTNGDLQTALAEANADLADAQAALDAAAGVPGGLTELLEEHGITLDGANLHIPNVAPDEGLSAPFNSWFTLFGQFFDHGLDLVNKGGNGSVMIPLQPDDPLYDPTPGAANFMVLTRATTSPGADGHLGDNPMTPGVDESLDDGRPVNTTTSYVDQNQTYTSHPSHQVFLRQYVSTPNGPAATGKLIEGANGGMATWAEVKAQAANVLGIQLTDLDVGAVPLMRTDPYGNFIPGANGYPQLIIGIGADNIPNTSDDVVIEGNPADPVDPHNVFGTTEPTVPVRSVFTNHAFLADIAHGAAPEGLADGDTEIGGNIPVDGEYDNELLDAHFIAGDGRANENIGLTAVHHVFHSEHNRLVEHTKEVVLADAQAILDGGGSQAEAVAFLNEWLAVDVANVPANATGLVWDGERLFQAAKFGTEMQYQHLVFEEFARKVQPTINTFLVPDGFDTTIDPSIVAEFAHVVYRFGHSMLTESIDQFDPNFAPNHISLIQGFLNPTAFTGPGGTIDDDVAAGAIIRGMTRQVGNEIDEFVTSALRNNLLGLPLDLATINLARGRDTGVPSLNEARRTFYEATAQDVRLKPYESWVDYAGHLKHEASIINFIAAYGTHELIEAETTIVGKRAAAMAIILGVDQDVDDNGDGIVDRTISPPADATDFLNGLGDYATDLGGLENVDLWIGGLAEEIMPFGGMLGATFNFVFEVQMEMLQNGDRFYYLQRLDGLHLFGEMENNSFAAMIMRNTNATHLPSDVFSTPGLILEVDPTRQFNDLNGDGTLEGGDPVGGGILTQLVVRNNPGTVGPDTNYLRYTGGDHVVMGGTDGEDIIIAGIGDDTLYGDAGDDNLEGGFGNDIINGGDGDDIIKDAGGDDNIKAGLGNDVVHAGPGLDLVMGNAGQDFIFLGTDEGSEVFAGEGNDFIYGNRNAERILGNEGNDWIETGTFDGAPGDNFDEIFAHDGIKGHDVFLGDGGFDEFIGEGGDDIMVGSAGRGKMVGMSGFDWATYKDNTLGVNADLSIPIIFDEAPTLPQNAALDEYESVEGLSGTKFSDVLKGTDDVAADRAPLLAGGTTGYLGSVLDEEGIALIAGLQEVLGGLTSFDGGDIILGGDGSDTITGNGGDDIIDGDKWLDVQIGVFAPGDADHTGTPIALHSSMTTLAASMFNGSINPGQLGIVRTIRNSTTQEANGETTDSDGIADVDRVVFSGARDEYDIDFNPDGTITVAHTGGLATDGTDTVRNVEVLDFTDQDILLQAPTLDLHGPVTTTSTASAPQAYRDTFDTAAHNNSNGTVDWTLSPWTETGDDSGVTTGEIQIDGGGSNELRFLGGDGASITRTVNLAGLTTATLSFSYDRNNGTSSIDAGETVQVQYSASGSFTPGNFTVLQTINDTSGGFDGADTSSFNLNLTGAGANSAIRFVSTGIDAGEYVLINNFNIATTTVTTTTVPGGPGNNYTTTFTEDGGAVAIVAGPVVTDDGPTIVSARVVLTNASAGDVLSTVGGLPGGINATIDNSVAGQITLNLTGNASPAAYQTALAQVRFNNTSQNPDAAPRVLQVTVNDGLLTSAVATTTVTVVPQNDAPTAGADTILTNLAAGATISVSAAALLANDTDPEGQAVTLNSVGGANGLASGPTLTAGVVTLSDNATANGSFTYVAGDGAATANSTVGLTRVTTANLTGGANAEIIIGNAAANVIAGAGGNDNINAGDGSDSITGGTGNDIIAAGTGNDTITWNANGTGATDGFDIIDGQEGGTDTFVLNGRAGTAETFRIYARAEAIDAGIPVVGLNSEIVITRTVLGDTTVIAELDNIEEISINGLNTTANNGNNPNTPDGGTADGDTIQVIGNFNSPFTSLNFSTITIDGNAGDDTIDITGLASDHRIVFRSNGGSDRIIGTLRPQDVIELPQGSVLADYVVTENNDGTKTLANATTSITYSGEGAPEVRVAGAGSDEDGTPGAVPGTGTPNSDVLVGTAGDDNLIAFAGDDVAMGNAGADAISAGEGGDFVSGGSGRDVIFAGAGDDQVFAGADADIVYGDAGADRIFGDQGNDLINAGAGDDTVFGGAGDDLIVAEAADGNDVYFGDEGGGGSGVDTLDISAATANVTVNLGSGPLSNGTVVSSQTGNDTIWGIENVNTGSGNDTITASNAANVMNGGSGNDTYKFTSASAANGDTILTFEAGDRIDLTAIDANLGTAGDQSFSLVTGAFTAAGQLAVTYETRADGNFTVVQGNIGGSTDADFTIEIAGHQNLTNTNLGL